MHPLLRLKRFSEQIANHFKKHRNHLFLVICLILVGLFALSFVRSMLVVVGLVFIGSISMIYNRFIRISVGVELITLATVMTALHYGSLAGMVVGAITFFLAELLAWDINYHIFVSLIGMLAIGFLAPFLSALPLVVIGMSLTILYNAIIMPLYLLMGSNPVKCAIFTITHILFNTWVFSTIAPIVQRMIN